MKTLWTPWRMEHVTGSAPLQEGCPFEPPGDTSCSREHLLLYRDRQSVVLLNRFPYANGHLLVAPRRHAGDLTALTAGEGSAMMQLLQQSCRILRRHLRPDGINIGVNLGPAAGAGIADHLHVHVVPRWEGDHNFMAVTADLRTIPQHIDHTYTILLDDFQHLLRENDVQPTG